MTNPTNSQAPENAPQKCHVRRHLTPSEFMTYDTMRGMAKKNEMYNVLLCYARLTTIANHNNLSRDQNRRNIESLVQKEWLVPFSSARWRGGRFGSNSYHVVTHEEYMDDFDPETAQPCPPFLYDSSTGEKLEKSETPEAKDFVLSMWVKRYVRKNRAWLDMLASALHDMADEEAE